MDNLFSSITVVDVFVNDRRHRQRTNLRQVDQQLILQRLRQDGVHLWRSPRGIVRGGYFDGRFNGGGREERIVFAQEVFRAHAWEIDGGR